VTILLHDDMEGHEMGRRERARTASIADLAVTALGIAGFLGFLLAARMDNDRNASPFDIFAFVWFFTFGGIKIYLPRLLSRPVAAKRGSGRSAVGTDLGT
jgi:hypothetical protein